VRRGTGDTELNTDATEGATCESAVSLSTAGFLPANASPAVPGTDRDPLETTRELACTHPRLFMSTSIVAVEDLRPVG
jgi:hypothetical protein